MDDIIPPRRATLDNPVRGSDAAGREHNERHR
jgi:hypothetical protein